MERREKVFDFLRREGFEYSFYEHPEAPTAEIAQQYCRNDGARHCKKLKGAATTAATNIAESVGSFFGGGKMKALERRNDDLQDRILELEEEARQREQQQTKQIQEIKTAYEQQNSKLSEFVDFVKRYFPHVEKLMPTIKFLRDTLNFGDAVIENYALSRMFPLKANCIHVSLTNTLGQIVLFAPSNRTQKESLISR